MREQRENCYKKSIRLTELFLKEKINKYNYWCYYGKVFTFYHYNVDTIVIIK